MSNKLPGWERKLIEYIAARSGEAFRPGRIDCAIFFGGAYLAMTGQDYVSSVIGKYRSIKGGMKLLSDMGYKDHVEYVASILPELPSALHAQRGDGVVIETDEGPALGVVQGENVYVMGLTGVTLVPLTKASRAFRV